MFFYSFCFSQNLNDREKVKITPNGILDNVFDQNGNKYTLMDILVGNNTVSTVPSNLISCSSTSYFNLYFEQGCGMEDTSNPVHNARRAVVCKVFDDLSNFINSPLSTTGSKINIWVRNINNVYANPIGILGLGTGFYCLPSSSTTGGVTDNEIWKTIHTGVDSYLTNAVPLTSLGNQSGMFYHGMITFNFNTTDNPSVPNVPNINWNTSLTATTIPTSQYDLYSAVLHEMMHALGINSLIDANGNSKFGSNFKFYSRYDTFLKTNDSNKFLLTTTACSPIYDLGFNSSLSHFEDALYPSCSNPAGNDSYFLMCNAGNSGIIRRYLKPAERQAVCDIGYSVKTTFGVSTTYNGYYDYGSTSACGGIVVAGTNDGMNATGGYTFIGTVVGSTATITLSGFTILSNDKNASSFTCLQDLTATATLPTTLSFSTGGTIGTTTTIITFTSGLAGLHLLRYVPVNGTQKGNITYIYVMVQPIPTSISCNPTPTVCNLVNNGNFSQNSSLPTNYSYPTLGDNQLERACGWFRVGNGTPDYHHTTCPVMINVPCNAFGTESDKYPSVLPAGDGYAGMSTTIYPTFTVNEILGTHLSTILQPETTYQLKIDISLADFYSFNSYKFQAFISSTPPANITGGILPTSIILNTGKLLTNPTFSNTTNGWETITFTFTTTINDVNLEFLYLGALNSVSTNVETPPTGLISCTTTPNPTTYLPHYNYYYIDNVSLTATGGAILNLPSSICVNQTLTNLTAYLGSVVTDGIFSGTGVSYINGNYSFYATTTGNYIINYTYNNNLGCPITISDSIQVTSIPSNTIPIDAINDDFTSMPLNGVTGDVSYGSVYANDFYNGLPTTSVSLPNVIFSLVNPVSITGASINQMGLISIPAGTPSGSYTLTYMLSVIGNCSIVDTATVTIYVSNNFIDTPSLSTSIRANNSVTELGIQDTGKIIIFGGFTKYNNITRTNFTRLNPDLTLDTNFSTYQPGNIEQMVVLPNNKIITALGFYSGSSIGIKRLLENGSLDTSFNVGGTNIGIGSGTNQAAFSCAIQPSNNNIYLGGDFYYYNGIKRLGIVRMFPEGAIDVNFNPIEINTYYRSVTAAIAIQNDNTVVIGGVFEEPTSDPNRVKNIIRLEANGSVSSTSLFAKGSFNGSVNYQSISVSLISPVSKIIVQPDGKTIVIGAFTKYNGVSVNCIVRLLPNGQLDPTFQTAIGVNRAINDVLIEPGSNKIIIAGEFTTFNGLPVKKMIRLNTDGNLDATFSIGMGTVDAGAPGPGSQLYFGYN